MSLVDEIIRNSNIRFTNVRPLYSFFVVVGKITFTHLENFPEFVAHLVTTHHVQCTPVIISFKMCAITSDPIRFNYSANLIRFKRPTTKSTSFRVVFWCPNLQYDYEKKENKSNYSYVFFPLIFDERHCNSGTKRKPIDGIFIYS